MTIFQATTLIYYLLCILKSTTTVHLPLKIQKAKTQGLSLGVVASPSVCIHNVTGDTVPPCSPLAFHFSNTVVT